MAAECGWTQESQIRDVRNQTKLVSVSQEELQPGMVLLVEVVVDVLGEIGRHFRLGQSQPLGPSLCQGREAVRPKAMVA